MKKQAITIKPAALETRVLTQDVDLSVNLQAFSSINQCVEKMNAFRRLLGKSKIDTSSNVVDQNKSSSSPLDERTTSSSTTHDSFIKEVLKYKLEIRKAGDRFSAYEEESLNFQREALECNKRVSSAREEVLSLQVALKHQESIRKHRELLEDSSKNVNELPTRSSLKRKIDEAYEEVNALDDSITSAKHQILSRLDDFENLKSAISKMQSIRNDDDLNFQDDQVVHSTNSNSRDQISRVDH